MTFPPVNASRLLAISPTTKKTFFKTFVHEILYAAEELHFCCYFSLAIREARYYLTALAICSIIQFEKSYFLVSKSFSRNLHFKLSLNIRYSFMLQPVAKKRQYQAIKNSVRNLSVTHILSMFPEALLQNYRTWVFLWDTSAVFNLQNLTRTWPKIIAVALIPKKM